ncbi:Uncharacterised protein [Streptococcus pneumoniae]|nr:Uncharacterised protein [Streptococcus pneumoniae]
MGQEYGQYLQTHQFYLVSLSVERLYEAALQSSLYALVLSQSLVLHCLQ